MNINRGLYDVLDVDPFATSADICVAYKLKAKETHPDAGGEHGEFIRVAKAFEILSDPDLRERYDRTGETDPNGNQVAQKIAIEIFREALQYESIGLTIMIARIVESRLEEAEDEKAQHEKTAAWLRGQSDMIKKAPARDFIAVDIARGIDQITAQIRIAEAQADDIKAAADLLGEYEFRGMFGVEAIGYGSTTATTSTW